MYFNALQRTARPLYECSNCGETWQRPYEVSDELLDEFAMCKRSVLRYGTIPQDALQLRQRHDPRRASPGVEGAQRPRALADPEAVVVGTIYQHQSGAQKRKGHMLAVPHAGSFVKRLARTLDKTSFIYVLPRGKTAATMTDAEWKVVRKHCQARPWLVHCALQELAATNPEECAGRFSRVPRRPLRRRSTTAGRPPVT